MNDFNFINKITNVKIGVTKEMVQDAIKKEKSEILAYRVYGRAQGFEIVSTDNGESNKYLGEFEAVNALTGEVFRSKSLYLPGLASDILEDQLTNANDKDPSETTVKRETKRGTVEGRVLKFEKQIEFGMDITASPSTSATGYEWGAKPIIETKQEDPFKALKGKIQAKPLPKPVQKKAVAA